MLVYYYTMHVIYKDAGSDLGKGASHNESQAFCSTP